MPEVLLATILHGADSFARAPEPLSHLHAVLAHGPRAAGRLDGACVAEAVS